MIPLCHNAENAVLKILVVDDEPAILRLTKSALEVGGYEVITASSAEHGLKICHEMAGALSLVISDVTMPGMNGREFARCVANLHNPIPVILMSGYTDAGPLIDELRDGNVDSLCFLQKPFDYRELLDLVLAMINPSALPSQP